MSERMTCTRAEPTHDGRFRYEFRGNEGTAVRVFCAAPLAVEVDGEYALAIMRAAPRQVGPDVVTAPGMSPSLVRVALGGSVTAPQEG